MRNRLFKLSGTSMPYVSARASKSAKDNDSRYARVIAYFFIMRLIILEKEILVKADFSCYNMIETRIGKAQKSAGEIKT